MLVYGFDALALTLNLQDHYLHSVFKLEFHDADTDILARIVARMSACRTTSLFN